MVNTICFSGRYMAFEEYGGIGVAGLDTDGLWRNIEVERIDTHTQEGDVFFVTRIVSLIRGVSYVEETRRLCRRGLRRQPEDNARIAAEAKPSVCHLDGK
ncbi:hypothetical protein Hamer_G009021, partial [Homarus americanus]